MQDTVNLTTYKVIEINYYRRCRQAGFGTELTTKCHSNFQKEKYLLMDHN